MILDQSGWVDSGKSSGRGLWEVYGTREQNKYRSPEEYNQLGDLGLKKRRNPRKMSLPLYQMQES